MTDTKYAVVVVPDEDDGGYYAYIPDLQGCMGDGDTPEEAISDVISASKEWLAAQRDRGVAIPEPGEEAAMIEAAELEREEYIRTLEADLAHAKRELRRLKGRTILKSGIRKMSGEFRAA